MELEAIRAVRGHFETLFAAVRHNRGRGFAAQPIVRLHHPVWNHVLWCDLWDVALESDAVEAFHALAQGTPRDSLAAAWRLAVEWHDVAAVCALALHVKRADSDSGPRSVIPLINCGAPACADCAAMRRAAVRHLGTWVDPQSGRGVLDDDLALLRAHVRDLCRRGIMRMHRPILLTSPKTDAVYEAVHAAAQRRWTTVLAASMLVAAWRRWVARQAEPGGALARVVARRWESMQTSR